MERVRGFTLVEIMMVVVLIGVIAAAAFLLLRTGTGAADHVADRSVEGTAAMMASSEIEALLANAAYPGDIFRLEEPVSQMEEGSFSFTSNTLNPGELGPEDMVTIENRNGSIVAYDGNDASLMPPVPGAEISFVYTDGTGSETTDPELLRTVSWQMTLESGTVYSGSSTPYNLSLAGLSDNDYREVWIASGGELGRWTDYKFQEDFETHPGYVFEDNMEGGYVWEPILWEDFESAASWANNWETWIDDPGYGRIERVTNASLSYEGSNCLVLDCWKSGLSTEMGIWFVDIADYADTDLRLRFHWRESNDELDYADGVFLPEFVAGDTTVIDIEDFSGFRTLGESRDWTYWTNEYGRITVTQDYPTNGNYVNMDSRRNGGDNECRIMNTYDLSAYSGSSDVWLKYDFTHRGDETSAGDFIGLMDGSIQGVPVAQVALNPAAYPAGSWISRQVDLDELAPAGYDWSDFRIVFAQQDNYPTTSSTGSDGISIDNVQVVDQLAEYWDLTNRILQAPSSFNAWRGDTLDLTGAASSAGVPITDDFEIGFAATTRHPYNIDGILYDAIYIDARNFGMEGWTHGVWPGYTEDEWVAVNNPTDAHTGNWYYAVGGTGNYNTTPTQAWLQSPEIDLTSFSPGDRVAVAFFHKYDFGNAGGGCNVKITADNGATWDIIAPYFGYYTSSVPALNNEPGWTGQNYGWGSSGEASYDFAVFDITDYAGETVRLRFNYGTAGESHGGWQVDYCRSRGGADWPQVALGGSNFDWFAYSNSGAPDPSSTTNGSLWAGNDMSLSGGYDRMYEPNQNNFLLSPPVCFDNDTGAGRYSYIEFIASPRTYDAGDVVLFECTAFGVVAPPSWFQVFSAYGVAGNFETFRYRIDWLDPTIVWPPSANQTVLFRWRMLSNGDSDTHGGWNLDYIRCYTTDQYLPDIFYGTPVLDGETDYGDLTIVPVENVREPYSTLPPRVSPLDIPGEFRRRLEENR